MPLSSSNEFDELDREIQQVSNDSYNQDDEIMDYIDSSGLDDSELEQSAAAMSLQETLSSSVNSRNANNFPLAPARLTNTTAPYMGTSIIPAADARPFPQQQTEHRLKPIYATFSRPCMSMLEELRNAIGTDNFITKSTQRGTEITCLDVSSRRKLIEYLSANNIEYFTHVGKKQTRVYIRHLNFGTSLEWIRRELAQLGHRAIYIAVDKNPSSGLPLDAFHAVIESSDNINNIYNINRLGNQSVRIEKAVRQAEPTQCHRCQQFGHSKNGCNQQFICLKCACHHDWRQCNKPANQAPRCANCGEGHPANYRGCKAYKAALAAIKKQQNKQHRQRNNNRSQEPHITSTLNSRLPQPHTNTTVQQSNNISHQLDPTQDLSNPTQSNAFIPTHQWRKMLRLQHFRQIQLDQRLQRRAEMNYAQQPSQQQLL